MAASFYGRSRLPFASPQNSPNPSLQLPGATQAAADLSCSSNKSLRPWQCPFKEVQGCRLPAFKTLKPSPAAPTRHSGRGRPFLQLQQVPEAVAASFYGRSRLPFASPQNSPNPSLQLPGATQAAADLSCSYHNSKRNDISLSLSLYRTTPNRGVGGTRALAHSIYIYICVCVCVRVCKYILASDMQLKRHTCACA